MAAAYRSEQEAADKVLRLGPAIDACLFASQVPYEYARRAGTLRVPATYVPLSGSALYAALLRASRELGQDLSRVSVDVLSRADVEDAFAELGVPAAGVHVREDAANAATLAAFHERLWRREEITVAFTCLQSVAQRLSAADVPVRILRPTSSAIRAALRTATLLAGNRRLEEAQLAVALVEVPTLRDTSRRSSPRHAREELRLTVHRFLVQEAQRMHASVSPVSDHCFLVTATRGSLAAATDGFRVPPFSERARTELGIAVEVGIGMGRTAQDAEAHAQAALSRSPRGRRAPGGSPWTGRAWRWSPRPGTRPPRPRRPAGPAAWRPCPGWPTSWPAATARSWSTRRPRAGCWASPPAPPGGSCTAWSRRGWPGRCRRAGRRSRAARASSTGWSPRSWSAAAPPVTVRAAPGKAGQRPGRPPG